MLDDPQNSGSFTGEVARAVERHAPARIVVTEPGEWRVLAMIEAWEMLLGVPVEVRRDTRFIAGIGEFRDWAEGRKTLRMEFFYREMRRATGLLMDGGQPCGGQWNFDSDNRKPARNGPPVPAVPHYLADAATNAVIAMVAARFPANIGSLAAFGLAVTRADALDALARFVAEALPRFGDYQDAMLSDQPLLWHALLSPYLNIGLLGPREVCAAAEAAYRAGDVPLNAAEGFIRQIIGWREYIRGIYWWAGPGYGARNFLAATRPLPGFYWTGDTGMKCLAQSIGQTIDLAYAHHIQRLMITGNFALLIGADPAAVAAWYLEVYADAYEWVELPNVLGMALFGDGGLLASKPYAASGAYIDRMSDYCRGCRYDVKAKLGADACPFNALYWDFLARHRGKLGGNPRLAMPYRNWDRMADTAQAAIRAQAAGFLDGLA